MATIRRMREFPLMEPNAGLLQIRMITKAMLPSGFGAHTLQDCSVEFRFNPLYDLGSAGNAFSFFLIKLARCSSMDPVLRRRIAFQMARFAFYHVRCRGWRNGLYMSTVLETVHVLGERRSRQPQAQFVDGNLIFNDTTPSFSAIPDYNAVDEVIFGEMIRSFESMETPSNEYEDDEDDSRPIGLSERDISLLKKELFDGDEKDESCCVCLEEFSKGAVITPLSPCSHKFHNKCIVKWLRKNKTCPICRSRCTVV